MSQHSLILTNDSHYGLYGLSFGSAVCVLLAVLLGASHYFLPAGSPHLLCVGIVNLLPLLGWLQALVCFCTFTAVQLHHQLRPQFSWDSLYTALHLYTRQQGCQWARRCWCVPVCIACKTESVTSCAGKLEERAECKRGKETETEQYNFLSQLLDRCSGRRAWTDVRGRQRADWSKRV